MHSITVQDLNQLPWWLGLILPSLVMLVLYIRAIKEDYKIGRFTKARLSKAAFPIEDDSGFIIGLLGIFCAGGYYIKFGFWMVVSILLGLITSVAIFVLLHLLNQVFLLFVIRTLENKAIKKLKKDSDG